MKRDSRNPKVRPRSPLTRERVLRAAITFADGNGIESLSMRKLGQQLGVEAMSLYNHVANKDEILDGMVDLVVGEFRLPSAKGPWRDALRETAKSVRATLRCHPWAAALVESRVTPSDVRFRYSDAVIGALRRAGFSIAEAHQAQLTISSYIYGFALQEVSWPFEPQELRGVVAALQPRIAPDEHPYLAEMLDWLTEVSDSKSDRGAFGAHEPNFDFGLDLILDGLERGRRRSR